MAHSLSLTHSLTRTKHKIPPVFQVAQEARAGSQKADYSGRVSTNHDPPHDQVRADSGQARAV